MTNCEYCDYFKMIGGRNTAELNAKGLCSFSNVIIITDSGNKDVEYPCKDISYQDYLERKNNRVPEKIMNENWKLMYKSKHPIMERNRSIRIKSAL